MGTNGFTILKDGNTITDQSSNSNDWALGGGTLIQTEVSDNVRYFDTLQTNLTLVNVIIQQQQQIINMVFQPSELVASIILN